MASNEDAGSSSSPSVAEKDNQKMQDLLSQINQDTLGFAQGMEDMVTKIEEDEQLVLAIVRSVDQNMMKFNRHITELAEVISKQQHRGETVTGEDAATRKKVVEEMLAFIEKLNELFKKREKRYKESSAALMERTRQQKRWMENSVDGLMAKLSKVAQQVNELKDYNNP